MVLGLRLPSPESAAWVWAGRLLFVAAGSAVAWFLLLMAGGQARAAAPPVLPCAASDVADGHHPASPDVDPAAVPSVPDECTIPPLDGDELTPPAPPAGRAGVPVPPIALDDLLPLAALDQQARRASAEPDRTSADVGGHGHAVVAAPVAAGTVPEGAGHEGAGNAAPELPGAPATVAKDMRVRAPAAHPVPPGRTTSARAGVTGTHGTRADSDVVPRPGDPPASAVGWVETSGPAPVNAGVRPWTGSGSPGDAGLPPLPLPASPGPCAGASTTTASGSGGNDRFDALAVLGGRQQRILPAGSSGVAPSSDGNAIRAQARPEPRPD